VTSRIWEERARRNIWNDDSEVSILCGTWMVISAEGTGKDVQVERMTYVRYLSYMQWRSLPII
jgi:hypothetical protein